MSIAASTAGESVRALRPVPVRGSAEWRLLGRLLALGGGLALFYAVGWAWLRAATRAAAAFLLAMAGHDVSLLDEGGRLCLVLDGGHLFEVTAACTYVDLLLCAAPFVWRFGRSIAANARRIAALAALVAALDLVRVGLALHLYERGVGWRFCHDLPDVLLHTAVLTVVVLSAFRADRV